MRPEHRGYEAQHGESEGRRFPKKPPLQQVQHQGDGVDSWLYGLFELWGE
jgi:hypothetical protein